MYLYNIYTLYKLYIYTHMYKNYIYVNMLMKGRPRERKQLYCGLW